MLRLFVYYLIYWCVLCFQIVRVINSWFWFFSLLFFIFLLLFFFVIFLFMIFWRFYWCISKFWINITESNWLSKVTITYIFTVNKSRICKGEFSKSLSYFVSTNYCIIYPFFFHQGLEILFRHEILLFFLLLYLSVSLT